MPSLNNYLWVLGPEGLGPGANMEVFKISQGSVTVKTFGLSTPASSEAHRRTPLKVTQRAGGQGQASALSSRVPLHPHPGLG